MFPIRDNWGWIRMPELAMTLKYDYRKQIESAEFFQLNKQTTKANKQTSKKQTNLSLSHMTYSVISGTENFYQHVFVSTQALWSDFRRADITR